VPSSERDGAVERIETERPLDEVAAAVRGSRGSTGRGEVGGAVRVSGMVGMLLAE
jgi:hypothetical protein